MPNHWIPRASLAEDLLELFRKDNETVIGIDPIPDELGRVQVWTVTRGAMLEKRIVS